MGARGWERGGAKVWGGMCGWGLCEGRGQHRSHTLTPLRLPRSFTQCSSLSWS